MKKLAKEVAELERIIQFSQDKNEINEAKDKQVHLMDSADLELTEMLELDLLVQKYL